MKKVKDLGGLGDWKAGIRTTMSSPDIRVSKSGDVKKIAKKRGRHSRDGPRQRSAHAGRERVRVK